MMPIMRMRSAILTIAYWIWEVFSVLISSRVIAVSKAFLFQENVICFLLFQVR